MKNWFFSLNGAVSLSWITLLTHMWRGFLDAMFVLPLDFGNENLMHMAAVIFTLLFAGWAWALIKAGRGSQVGLVSAFVINALVLIAIPISWLIFYCPTACRAEAGIFNLANSLNLILGLMAGISLANQLRQKSQIIAQT